MMKKEGEQNLINIRVYLNMLNIAVERPDLDVFK